MARRPRDVNAAELLGQILQADCFAGLRLCASPCNASKEPRIVFKLKVEPIVLVRKPNYRSDRSTVFHEDNVVACRLLKHSI